MRVLGKDWGLPMCGLHPQRLAPVSRCCAATWWLTCPHTMHAVLRSSFAGVKMTKLTNSRGYCGA